MTDSQACSQLSILQLVDGSSSEYTDDDCEEFGDIHRMVLQVIFGAGWMDSKGVKKLFQETCKYLECEGPDGEHVSPPFIQKVVREINEKTKPFHLMIRSASCEISGGKYYVCLVTTEMQIMRVQTFFTKPELDLFQMIILSVLRKHDNFRIPMNECINLAAELNHRFSKVNAEDFVNKMIALQYFARVFLDKENEEFEVTLGFRTIREFEAIFRCMYSDCFGTCALCKTILLNGLICKTCPTVYHRVCLKNYMKTCKNCVVCKGKWKGEESLLTRTKSRGGADTPRPPPPPTPKSSQKKSQGSLSSKTGDGGKDQGRKAAAGDKKASASKTGDEVEMPILEPMVTPGNAAGTGMSSKSKGNEDAPKLTPAISEDESPK